MSLSPLDYAQKHFPHPIASCVFGLNRAVSSHEKRDRIIEVFRTSIRILCAYAIGVRTQFGEGPDGTSKTLSGLVEGLRRRGLDSTRAATRIQIETGAVSHSWNGAALSQKTIRLCSADQ